MERRHVWAGGRVCHQPVPRRAPPKLGAESCCFSHVSCAGAEGRAEPAQGQAGFQLKMGPHMPRPWDRNDVLGRGRGQEGGTTSTCPTILLGWP